MPRSRRFGLVLAVVASAFALVLGEALVWVASPTEYMHPRYQFSSHYGLIPFPDVVMVHGVPRKYEFRYTVNHQQCRGAAAVTDASIPTVVVLGDSYGFGMGVEDGEEFPAVMGRALQGQWNVVNLASPGWGLTQEIRRFYELGVSYNPQVVVLQYCSNDPDDNLANRVTMVKDGDFVFVDSDNPLNWVKKYLSKSFVQRTQLYNFARARASRALLPRQVAHEAAQLQVAGEAAQPQVAGKAAQLQVAGEAAQPQVAGTEMPATPQERVYVELLSTFAGKLAATGRHLVLISVDRQLAEAPYIHRAVLDLQSQGVLEYVEVLDWLEGRQPYGSPEGHIWGAPAHKVIGEELAAHIAGYASRGSPSMTVDASR